MPHFLLFDLDLRSRSKVKVIARGQGQSSRSNVGRVVVDIWARLAKCSKSTMTHGIQSKISVSLSVTRGHSQSKTTTDGNWYIRAHHAWGGDIWFYFALLWGQTLGPMKNVRCAVLNNCLDCRVREINLSLAGHFEPVDSSSPDIWLILTTALRRTFFKIGWTCPANFAYSGIVDTWGKRVSTIRKYKTLCILTTRFMKY